MLLCIPAWASAQPAPYEVIHTLTGPEGAGSQSGLVRGADNLLYGAATLSEEPAGVDDPPPTRAGTIFRVAPDGTFEVVHTFLTAAPEGGLNPVSLMRGRDKHLYGTTDFGGAFGDGTIYRLNWNEGSGTYAGVDVIHEFNCADSNGGDPWGTLAEGPDGALYGVTAPSKTPDPACTEPTAVYKLNKDGSGFEVLAKFEYPVTGGYQFGPLAFASDGSVIGTLSDSANPAFALGSVFKIAPNRTVSYLKIFSGPDGAYPFSGVVRGIDGAFYGTTYAGGAEGVGTIFRIDEVGNFTTLYSFEAASLRTPYSPLVVGGDGKLYGAAHEGGASGQGGTYVFDPPLPIGSGVGFTPHFSFDDPTTGSSPWGPLGVGPSPQRHLYGTQSSGGSTGQGTLFGLLDIQVVNRPPVPVVMASPNPAQAQSAAGATVLLSALGSSDADFDDLTYAWTLPTEAADPIEAPDSSTVSATFPVGTWPVTLTVSDGTDSTQITVSVTVVDGPPVFSAVADISLPATGPAGALVTYPLPTATDMVDGDRTVTCSPPSGSTFEVGTTTVTCSASDGNGTVATTSFDVTVIDAVLLTVPSSLTVEATGSSGAIVDYSAQVSATSGTGDPLVPACAQASGTLFALGVTTVNCTATDPLSGVEGSASFDVHVVDTTPPLITMDINGIEFNSQGPFGALIQYDNPLLVGANDSPSAFDAVDGAVPVACNPGPGVFPLGRTRVTCEAVDAAGNRSTFTFDIVVRDSDDPVLTLPGPIFAPAQSATGAVVTFTVTATDLTSPVGLTVTCTPPSGSTFAIGQTTVTCVATDGAASYPDNFARTSTESFVVTVGDVTPPVLALPVSPITVQATGPSGAAVAYSAFATDNVLVTSFSCDRASGSTFALGSTLVQCTASDAAGNTASGAFTVNVIDTVGPTIAVPANIVVVTNNPAGATVTYPAATASDLVDGDRPVSCTPLSGSDFAVGVTTVTCVSADARGNSTSTSFTVTVSTQPPTLTVSLSPGVLWPPNHKLVTINATIIATSASGPAPTVKLVSITSNDPDNGLGDGDTANDIQQAAYGTDDRVFQLRAERSGKGNDRIYTVTYTATDAFNVTTTVQATVVVPHDMRNKKK